MTAVFAALPVFAVLTAAMFTALLVFAVLTAAMFAALPVFAVLTAAVFTAGVRFCAMLMVVMAAVNVWIKGKGVVQKGLYGLVGAALHPAVQLYARLGKGRLRTPADTAADEHIRFVGRQKTG